ncbi:MAG: hypothetical protein ACTHU0_01335 [Kofleriaceae bacterium]
MITIEALESLATEFVDNEQANRGRLERLCTAYARILGAREPERFDARACRYADEAGHWDSSFPPDQEYTDHTGPRSILLADSETEDVATSGGFYYDWTRTTTRGALAVGPDGEWYRSTETGTGAVGQYAAHPGNHRVDIEIEWQEVDATDLTTAELAAAEQELRKLAFPLVAERLASTL